MIRNSFVFLDRIGLARERAIWNSDVKDWNMFLNAGKVRFISDRSKHFYDRQIEKAKKSLLDDDSSFFSRRLPSSEHWRLYDSFCEQAVFLDIETSGLSVNDGITVIGLYDGKETKTMIRGMSLDFRKLEQELAKYKLIITFNGSSFDLPFISRFARIPDIPHFDLRFGCKRLGLEGGLKAIEKEVGIKRKNDVVAAMNGGDAAELWRMYKGSGDQYYLDLLVEYNEEDIINLKQLADFVYPRLKNRICSNSVNL